MVKSDCYVLQGPKKSRFQGPPLPMVLIMDIARTSKSSRPAPYEQQVHNYSYYIDWLGKSLFYRKFLHSKGYKKESCAQ